MGNPDNCQLYYECVETPVNGPRWNGRTCPVDAGGVSWKYDYIVERCMESYPLMAYNGTRTSESVSTTGYTHAAQLTNGTASWSNSTEDESSSSTVSFTSAAWNYSSGLETANTIKVDSDEPELFDNRTTVNVGYLSTTTLPARETLILCQPACPRECQVDLNYKQSPLASAQIVKKEVGVVQFRGGGIEQNS